MPRRPKGLRWDRLRATVNPKSLKIKSTENMKSLPEGVLGQERAREALKFGTLWSAGTKLRANGDAFTLVYNAPDGW